MLKCRQCGHLNDSSRFVCVECGSYLLSYYDPEEDDINYDYSGNKGDYDGNYFD